MYIAGRIEFLGKHTDYGGGRSLVCAIDRGFTVNFSPRNDKQINLKNLDSGEQISFELNGKLNIAETHWVRYPMTVARRITQNFKSRQLNGIDFEFTSDLPLAAGLSSSSALMMAFFFALSEANNLTAFDEYKLNILNDLDLAEYLGTIENGQNFRQLTGDRGVGTFGGSQDHTAILACQKNHLSQFSFAPVRHEKDIFISADYCFVIGVSGVTAEKTGSAKEKYNRVSLMVSEIVKNWKGAEKTLAKIIENVGVQELKAFITRNDFAFPTQDLLNRVEQFHIESFSIIPQVSTYLEQNNGAKIGELIDLSHQNAVRFLHNQTAETIYLQRSARQLGAIAASAFGAGFGGSVYALVNVSEAEKFCTDWGNSYLKKFPQFAKNASFFTTNTSESIV
jgi:galactokinase